jgi:hypothetical protein
MLIDWFEYLANTKQSKKAHIKFETGAELETTGHSVGMGGGMTAASGEHIGKKRKLCMEREKESNVPGDEDEPWLGDGLLNMLEEEAKLL